jgi:hypothetical protein
MLFATGSLPNGVTGASLPDMLRYDVMELVSGELIRPNLGAEEAYRVRDKMQDAMLRAGRSLKRKRYAVRPTEPQVQAERAA